MKNIIVLSLIILPNLCFAGFNLDPLKHRIIELYASGGVPTTLPEGRLLLVRFNCSGYVAATFNAPAAVFMDITNNTSKLDKVSIRLTLPKSHSGTNYTMYGGISELGYPVEIDNTSGDVSLRPVQFPVDKSVNQHQCRIGVIKVN